MSDRASSRIYDSARLAATYAHDRPPVHPRPSSARSARTCDSQGKALIGKTVRIAGGFLTGAQMAAALTTSLGQPVRYSEITPETYRGFDFPGADDLGNMFQVDRDFEKEMCAARSLDLSRALNPELQTFEQWLGRNTGRIPLEWRPAA